MSSFFASHTLAEKITGAAIKASGIAVCQEEMQYSEKHVLKESRTEPELSFHRARGCVEPPKDTHRDVLSYCPPRDLGRETKQTGRSPF